MSKLKDLEQSIAVIGGQLSAVQMLIDAMVVEGNRFNHSNLDRAHHSNSFRSPH
jgi:hypothetical protein